MRILGILLAAGGAGMTIVFLLPWRTWPLYKRQLTGRAVATFIGLLVLCLAGLIVMLIFNRA